MKNTFRLSVMLAMLFCCASVSAQQKSKLSSVYGTVVSEEDGKPVEFAFVTVSPSGLHAQTSYDGTFRLANVPAGESTLKVEFFGMETYEQTLHLKEGEAMKLDVVLKVTSFRLDNVVVTATRGEAGSSTASMISRQAMDHMQTSSLKDVMSLLPGVALSNPDLSSAQAITIRNNAGTSGMNSLGTAIIVDGAPMSNNANLQVLSTAQTGSTTSAGSSANIAGGVDIRSLSTDNVESVEVIRGIPSAQYGDLTSGAVLVTSKAGRSPLTLRFKTNPNIYQVSGAKGFSIGKKAGDLNLSADYAYNRNDLQAAYAHYQRVSAKGLWSVKPASGLSVNTSLALNYGNDTHELNPDFTADGTQSKAIDLGFQFNNNGRLDVNGAWFKSLNWILSGSFNNKVSHYESTASNALNLYSTAMEDGMTYTNIAGQHFYDGLTGEEFTNSTDTGISGRVLPYNYFYSYDIYGKELNGFAKLNANMGHTWGGFTENLLVGADFKTDGNLGKGAVYDDEAPPFRSVGNASSGYRRRPYYEIPFVNQLGAYVESTSSYRLGRRLFKLVAGARYDNVNSLSVLAPRINASADIFPWMTLRGGWGVTAKAPTSIYLNPNYAYLDALSYNGMLESRPESDRVLLATTRVYDSSNPDLEIATNRKAEIGLDLTVADRYKISLTAYDERMDNGYMFGLDETSFMWYSHDIWKEVSYTEGSLPVLAYDHSNRMFFEVYKPLNNMKTVNRGLEYEIDLGRFDAIRTSFYLNGAWTYGSSTNRGYSFSDRTSSTRSEWNVGVYNPEKVTDKVTSHITTLRMTHNIPQIGFVVTLTAQANWSYKYWSEYKNDDMFVAYISYEDGQMHDFDPSMKDDPDFSYLFPALSDTRFAVEHHQPYVLFNLQLTKELGDMLTASFYCNNLFNSRPLYRYKESGSKIELGIPTYFGFELKINIK